MSVTCERHPTKQFRRSDTIGIRCPPSAGLLRRMGRAWLGDIVMNSLWLSSDVSPILLANILIDLNGQTAAVERITTSALRAGNPIVLACLHTVVIGLEACTFEALEGL